MNKYLSTGVKTIIGILVVTTTSSGQTDPVTSIIPPGVLFEALAINRDLPTISRPKYNSPTDLAVSPDKKTLFVAQQTAKRIDIVDLASESVTGRIVVPNEITGIAVATKGDLLYATCSSDQWPAGRVCIVDITAQRVTQIIAVGYGARAPVVTPDGSKLFVCNRFSNDLSVIDLMSQREIKRIKTVREPYCAAVTPDGKTVVVGNLLSDDRSTDTSVISSKVSIVNVASLNIEKEISLPVGSYSLTGSIVSPDGNFAFVVHTLGHFNHVCTTVERGWLNQATVSIIDLNTREYVLSVPLDGTNFGMADPWDIAITDDQRYLAIVHAGSNELSVINYPQFIDSVKANKQREVNMDRNFTLISVVRKRIQTTGRNPRSLVVVDSTVYTAGFFDDEAAAVQKTIILNAALTDDAAVTTQFPVGRKVAPATARQGEALFYDASLCFGKWQSCHTCHLFTRVSGLNRILGGGAIVASKQNRSLLYSWWTPPTFWTGRRGHARNAVIASVELELFKQAEDSVTVPLDSFIMTLKPVPSPLLEKGKLSAAAEHGKELFYGDKAQCFECHSGPLFTDCNYHDALVPDPFDPQKEFDTPSLVEAWRTGPYGHIGSLGRIREIIELPGHGGAAAKLSSEEMDDLVAYVLSL